MKLKKEKKKIGKSPIFSGELFGKKDPTPKPVIPVPVVQEKLKLHPSVTELVSPTREPLNTPFPTPDPSSAPMRLIFGGVQTDFTNHSVPFSEIRSGDPPIDVPIFLCVGNTPDYMNDK